MLTQNYLLINLGNDTSRWFDLTSSLKSQFNISSIKMINTLFDIQLINKYVQWIVN